MVINYPRGLIFTIQEKKPSFRIHLRARTCYKKIRMLMTMRNRSGAISAYPSREAPEAKCAPGPDIPTGAARPITSVFENLKDSQVGLTVLSSCVKYLRIYKPTFLKFYFIKTFLLNFDT